MEKKNIYLYTIWLTLRYINKYPIFWFWFFVRVVYVAMLLAAPILLGKIIDMISRGNFDTSRLYLVAGTYVAILFVSPMLEIITASRALRIASKIAQDFRNDAVNMFEYAPLDFFKSKNRAVFVKVVDASYYAIYRLSEDITHRYVTSIGAVIGIFISSVIFQSWVIITFLLVSILSVINLIILNKKEKNASVELSRSEESFSGGLSEFLVNFKTIFYLNLFKKQETDLANKTNVSYGKRITMIKWSMRKWYINNQLQDVAAIVIFLFGLTSILHGNLTIGSLIVILTFSGRLSDQMGTILSYSSEYIDRATSIQRYRDELVKPLKEKKATRNKELAGQAFKQLTLQNVSVKRDERENLQDVGFEIFTGNKIAIVGHTGGGKSTLLDIILKAITDYQGNVSMNGINYRDLSGKDIAGIFSIVPQDVQLFRGTIQDNIASSERKPSSTELAALLDICKLSSFVGQLPNKADEMIIEGSANISGGERQRIGIARALFQQHPFLIFDEATASLDPKTEREVIENIIKAYPDITLLYITHKYALLDMFGIILVMNDGKIIESGSFEKLKSDGHLFRELYAASKLT